MVRDRWRVLPAINAKMKWRYRIRYCAQKK